jgi:FkbM family methyltransferase
MPKNKLKKYLRRLVEEKFSPRFIFRVILQRFKITLPLKLKIGEDAFIKLHPASIPLGIWQKKYSIETDKIVIEKIVKENFVCFDIGASVGHLSISMAKKAKNGLVISIEPSPKIFSYLLENIQINKVKNIIPLNVAISEENGIKEFFAFAYADDQSALVIDKDWRLEKYKVLTLRLDELLKILGINKIDFLKIDVEGAELLVLKSLGENIKCVKYIWFEFIEENYRKFNYSGKEIFSFLKSHNFSLFKLDAKDVFCEVKNSLEGFRGNLLAIKNG